jgi:hypothetical protein
MLLLSIGGLLVLLLIGYGAWTTRAPAQAPISTAQNSAASELTQTSTGGQVTLKAAWGGASAGPTFDVAMDTHAVDLDGYDLAQLAVLRVDGREARPTSWDAPKGGHHRQGTLRFPATGADGAPLVGPDSRAVELIIRDVAGVPERVLRWELPVSQLGRTRA